VKVRVKLFGLLRQHLPPQARGATFELELRDDASVDDLAVHLGIEEVPAVVCINDQETHRARRLREGDTVSFFPPLAGG
jgi:molybdopterin converting factor small subunit